MARTIGGFSRYESEHKSERAKAKARELVEKGAVEGRPASFGWQAMAGRKYPRKSRCCASHDADSGNETLRAISMDGKARGFVRRAAMRLSKRPYGRCAIPPARRENVAPRRLDCRTGPMGRVLSENDWQQLGLILRNKARNTRARRPARKYLLTAAAGC